MKINFAFQRPIVAFAIENRIMVNAKLKRLEKSRQRNPLYGKRPQPAEAVKLDERHGKKSRNTNDESFAGSKSKPGDTTKKGKFFFSKQAERHKDNLKKQKKTNKKIKQMAIQKKEQAVKRKEKRVRILCFQI